MQPEPRQSWSERIVIDEKILTGKPVIKGTRLAVEFIIDLLAHGWSETEILENYPALWLRIFGHVSLTQALRFMPKKFMHFRRG